MRADRIDRMMGMLRARGFEVDQCAAWLTGGWVRLYNVSRGAPLRDWTGEIKPRIYSDGAVGIQFSWRFVDDGEYVREVATRKTWRNGR
jgi:hypothetical protein